MRNKVLRDMYQLVSEYGVDKGDVAICNHHYGMNKSMVAYITKDTLFVKFERFNVASHGLALIIYEIKNGEYTVDTLIADRHGIKEIDTEYLDYDEFKQKLYSKLYNDDLYEPDEFIDCVG